LNGDVFIKGCVGVDKYSGLAYAYDQIMDHVPYDTWVSDLKKIFEQHGHKPVRILDCACGTGAMSNRLAKNGYVMTGIDLSEEMLVHAQENAFEEELKVRYLLMDMREIALRDKFDAVISYFDGANYLVERSDLEAFFTGVERVLNPGGMFIFDISSAFKMENTLGRNTFAESHEDLAFIWENYYDNATKMLQFDMTMFLEDESGLFERHFESHHLKAHSTDEIKEALPAGLELQTIVDGDTLGSVKEESERILFVLRKHA